MTFKEILETIEEAKKSGDERTTFKGMLDSNTVDKLQHEYNYAIFFTGVWDDGKTDTIVSWKPLDIEMRDLSEMLGGKWCYQIVHYEDEILPYYALNEIVHNKDGTVGLCMGRHIVMGYSVDEIKDSLKLMLQDVEDRPVLKQKDLP